MKFLAKYRVYFLRVCILLLIVLSVTNNDFRAYTLEITTIESLQMSILGFIMVVFGSFGRIWASLYIEGNKTKNLITAGPFSMVRNPLYFFSLIMLIGFSLALKAIYLPLALLLIFVLFHVPTIANEERKLRKNHGDKFESYMKSTPRLIPNIFKYNRPASEEKVLVNISRINSVLIEVIGYLFLYTVIDIIYFILN
ncbi:MAG: isoprenylcysteine carboxylmethyltransferase family protein [Candidatus Marinimicrobia bacterium]|nr:isoprenylcysteine carboxylmethyltransferase family protein [Candidatus Neomarinimicrobiota bacterium]MDA0753653.1 isoprenylcysteine carboxylmethyltransferase family protein [Candidatus Neomarinimicrobiota bacterium]MDA1363544.1 isoprenylcysteine carboxylmethyltransferase family protein [Candidatus Neomarinimicrobiota bacterium]